MKHLFLAALLSVCVGGWAGTPNYTYNRTIDIAPHPDAGRMTAGCTDDVGGLYFVCSSSDGNYYVPNVLTADGSSITDVKSVTVAAPEFTSGNSYEGVTWDGTKLYAGGKNGAGVSQYVKAVPDNPTNPASWTITVFSVPLELTGPVAVGPNTIAAAHVSDGTITFLQDTGAATLTVLGTTPVGSAGSAHEIEYDNTTNRMYVSIGTNTLTGQVNRWNSNGTLAGTTYPAANNPFITGAASTLIATSQGVRYQNVAVNKADQVLAVSRSVGTNPGNGHALYDATQPGPNATPYLTLNQGPSEIPSGTANTSGALGAAFGTVSGTKYLAVGSTANAVTNKIYVYTQGSSVSDWSVY